MLLLARDGAYNLLTWVAAAPLTTTLRNIPTAVTLDPQQDGVPKICAVTLDNVSAIRKQWLDSLVVRLRPERMAEVDRAIHFALGLRN